MNMSFQGATPGSITERSSAMKRSGIVILATCGAFMGWSLLSLVLLLYGNDWWLSGLTTLTVFIWLAGLLVVIYQQGSVRAAATGAVIASATYWLLALGPWFSTNVGPTLLTSRLLAHTDMLLHGGVPQTQAWPWTSYPPVYSTGNTIPLSTIPLSGSGYSGGPISFSTPTTTFLTVPISPAGAVFQAVGHWLFIWLAAALGGCAAFLMQVRSQSRARPARSLPASADEGQSPFAAAAHTPSTKANATPSGDVP
jgi:hypothetical protein